MKRHLVLVASLAALWLAAACQREPDDAEHEREQPLAEPRGPVARYQANYKALHGLIAEASGLQAAYLESDDLATFEKAGAAWEARAGEFLHVNLAPLYASEFARARYRGPDLPVGKDDKARAAYQRIEARKVLLKAYLSELRKPD